MTYYQEICLRDGTLCLLRSPEPEDAQAILDHMRQTSGETGYMARYPDEITMTAQQEADFLKSVRDSRNALMIAAVVDGRIVSNAGFNPVSPLEKYCHRAEFGISVQQAYWGRGIAAATMQAALGAARTAGYEQMELDVVTSNRRAIDLYRRFGFEIYGTRPHSFRYRDGHYESLHLMLRTL